MVRVAFEGHDLVASLEFIKADGALIAYILLTIADFLCFKFLLLSHLAIGCMQSYDGFLHAGGVHTKLNRLLPYLLYLV